MSGCGYPNEHCDFCADMYRMHLCDECGCLRWVYEDDPTTGTVTRDEWDDLESARCYEHTDVLPEVAQ